MDLNQLFEALAAAVFPVFTTLYQYLMSMYSSTSTLRSAAIPYFIGPPPETILNTTAVLMNATGLDASPLSSDELDNFQEAAIHPIFNFALNLWEQHLPELRVHLPFLSFSLFVRISSYICPLIRVFRRELSVL